MFCSTEMENGSIKWGVVHSAVTGFSGARRTSSCFTCAEARAISTARAAVASTPERDRSSDAAKPHAPSASTRTLRPSGFGIGGAADFAIFCGERAAAVVHDAGIGVACASRRGDIQSGVGELFHAEI